MPTRPKTHKEEGGIATATRQHTGLTDILKWVVKVSAVKARKPMTVAKQPGNIPDVISIENTLTQLKCFNLDKSLIVTDNGY